MGESGGSSSTKVGICFDIDNAEVSDSIIVERSPLPGLSVASEVCDVEDDDGASGRSQGGYPGTSITDLN